jgi:hypothetical protein
MYNFVMVTNMVGSWSKRLVASLGHALQSKTFLLFQFRVISLHFCWREPKPPQAGPKPGLLGQTGPGKSLFQVLQPDSAKLQPAGESDSDIYQEQDHVNSHHRLRNSQSTVYYYMFLKAV